MQSTNYNFASFNITEGLLQMGCARRPPFPRILIQLRALDDHKSVLADAKIAYSVTPDPLARFMCGNFVEWKRE